jgi:hypothetical protein
VGQLLFYVLVSVQAKLGIVGEVRAELQEEGAEIAVHAVNIKVIDHGGGTDQPGVGGPGLLIAPPLGAEHACFLLRLADEQYAFRCGELLPIGGGHIVFALTLFKQDDGDFLLFGKLIHLHDECLGDGIHQGTGGELVAAVKPEKAGHPSGALQRRHVYIQVHPVDALDFQGHMFRQNLRHTA